MHRTPVALGLLLIVVAACGGSTDSGLVTDTGSTPEVTTAVTDAPVDSTFTTTAPADTTTTTTTTAASTSTVAAPATTAAPAPATTTAPSGLTRAELVLRPDGIGPLAFGATDPTGFIATVASALGTPIQFTSETYPDDAGDYWENASTEGAFDFPFGETLCFANGLCAYFGGSAADAVRFVGYVQDQDGDALATASGVTANSVWADFSAAITMGDYACFSTGYGEADGVRIVVSSSGEPFEFYDDVADTYVTQIPDQNDVSVISLSAGSEPFFLFADC